LHENTAEASEYIKYVITFQFSVTHEKNAIALIYRGLLSGDLFTGRSSTANRRVLEDYLPSLFCEAHFQEIKAKGYSRVVQTHKIHVQISLNLLTIRRKFVSRLEKGFQRNI
jgi:hypothetical protein